ncbi:MAG: plasmid pRiA4b ORF-3 family protein [Candidatus Omnitrophota bacterium]
MKKQTNKICQFRIALQDVSPPIWRRILVQSDISLHRLSSTILLAMGWSGGHLHQFEINEKSYGIPDDDFDSDEDMNDERGFRLDDLDQGALKSFTFEYDFGDGWRHAVQLEDVLEPAKGQKYPLCISGARNCPPDDCGGTGGYEEFLAAIRNPKHPEHKSMTEWIGGRFDPEAFNLDQVNGVLQDVAKSEKQWWGC